MAESMKGLHRTARCAEITAEQIGQTVTLMGWVAKNRNKGGIIFVDLRDRSGIMQVIFDGERNDAATFEKAGSLRSEYVIAVTGTVARRSGAVNPNLRTGELELNADSMRILSESETPPFLVQDGIDTREDLRLKYRYLDLRRPELQKKIIFRSRIVQFMRDFLSSEGFLDIETPCLIKSTPEGARDYIVPSRLHHGNFYALPQSPQLFKQLLMCSGYDRYYQMARCFRDEDLRADRQPEFTQVDMELSFVTEDDVMDVNTRLLAYLLQHLPPVYDELGFAKELSDAAKKAGDQIAESGIPKMTWQNAMDHYGSDKPDLRFGLEIRDVTEQVKDCGFSVFSGAVKDGGLVRGLTVKGQAGMPRKKIDKLTETAKTYGAKGLAYAALEEDGTVKSSFAKFLSEEEMAGLAEAMGAEKGDLMLFAADKFRTVCASLGAVRLELGAELGLYDKNELKFTWITEFPLLEWSDEENRFMAMHHPFTMPNLEDWPKIDSDPGSVRAEAYDIVLNGTELGGGSVRIHMDDVQEKMFEALGFTKERAQEQFGFLLTAFKYGVPPHAGLAYGLDRVAMLLSGSDSIREVIAFPKVKDASDLMAGAPGTVEEKQLKELGIEIRAEEENTES
ncbi:MAG: aspartate--tRNA ligase [Lachnospiraceae bacterium]|jgi:aspartyl-tRNA synthetase|nr:aspartate--tRNA ligase [Lachnospiraceae bacterium]MCI1727799.1 aspartate--tRNA ligase [Lachnospiraceae bacterium]